MNNISRYSFFVLVVVFSLLLSACTIKIDRQADGSLSLETVMTQEQIANEINLAIGDTITKDLTVELKNGYIQLTGSRMRSSGQGSDILSARLDIKAAGGKLSVVVSQATLNDRPLEKAVVDQWNERIARQLERAAFRNPNASAQNVTITPKQVTFLYRIETMKSKGK